MKSCVLTPSTCASSPDISLCSVCHHVSFQLSFICLGYRNAGADNLWYWHLFLSCYRAEGDWNNQHRMENVKVFCPDHLQDFFLCFTKFFQYLCFILLRVCGFAQSDQYICLLKHTLFYITACMMLSSAFPLLVYCSKNACTYITKPCIFKKGWICIETRQRRCVESVYEESPHKLSFDTNCLTPPPPGT